MNTGTYIFCWLSQQLELGYQRALWEHLLATLLEYAGLEGGAAALHDLELCHLQL